jgi:hypothetical protein
MLAAGGVISGPARCPDDCCADKDIVIGYSLHLPFNRSWQTSPRTTSLNGEGQSRIEESDGCGVYTYVPYYSMTLIIRFFPFYFEVPGFYSTWSEICLHFSLMRVPCQFEPDLGGNTLCIYSPFDGRFHNRLKALANKIQSRAFPLDKSTPM